MHKRRVAYDGAVLVLHIDLANLTLKVLVATVGGDGGCRVGEVRAGTTSPMPDHKGFKLQQLVNFQKFSTLRVHRMLCKLRMA